jgi:hypothetical protein
MGCLLGSLDAFDSPYFRARRPACEHCSQALKLFLASGGIDFNAAIREIARISLQSQVTRRALREPSKADALDAALDKESACVGWHMGSFD